MEKYRSLQDVYLNKSFARSLPPLPRQTINWLMEAVADAPPPAPDSAYVQLYVKDPSKEEQQFVGNIDVDYFNKVVRPVLSRGSEGSIDVNRLIEKRLKDANVTTENLNTIFDFIKSTQMKITPENLNKCGALIKDNITKEIKFNLGDVLSASFAQNDTPQDREALSQSLQANSKQFNTVMQLKALAADADYGTRSGIAGPGEVILCFFGNGKKLLPGSKKGDTGGRGDIAIGELTLEVKGTQGRVHPLPGKLTYRNGTPRAKYAELLKTDPVLAVKYLVFGDEGLQSTDFDDEIKNLLQQKIDPNSIATGLALRQYQRISGFHYYCFADKESKNVVGMSTADKTLPEIGNWYKSNIGVLKFDTGGHRLADAIKI